MIIRFTFRDNDFTHVIEKFIGKNLFLNAKYGSTKMIETDFDKYLEIDDTIETMFKTSKPSKELKAKFLKVVKESFLRYLKDNESGSYEYLEKNLTIEEVESVQDKWENGEVVYYFMSADTYVTF